MAFWRPGARPPVAAQQELWDADRDAEQHRAPPAHNPREGLPLEQQRRRLPIYRHRLPLLYALETHITTVLCGPTGCGKSTQLPQYLDEAGWTKAGYVVGVTQPRRLAAVAVAGRVAQEMGVNLGEEVGYRIRFDSCVTPGKTRIEFMTEGVLLREMLSDPLLTRYGVLVVDEAHERSLHMDLLLGLLRKILRKRRQLRIVVASATADVSALLRFFRSRPGGAAGDGCAPAPERKRPRCGWDDESGEFHRQRAEDRDWRELCRGLGEGASGAAPLRDVCLVTVGSGLHPVTMHYLEEPACDYLRAAVETVLAIHRQQPEGDVLVFLAGQEEVEAACALLAERLAQLRERSAGRGERPRPLLAVPLYGALPQEAQLKAFAPPPRGGRKAVVSTNLAEASITIEGIAYVVDACLAKVGSFCPANGASYLNVAPCSRSSARQRAGRAGRCRPGHCYRLLTEAAFRSLLPPQGLPELARADLREPVLLLKCLGVDDVGAFDFPTPPCREAVEAALEELLALGALDREARVLEPLGPRLAHAPLPLGLARLLLLSAEPAFACSSEAAAACAMLSVRPPWLPSPRAERLQACKQSFASQEGDLVTLVNVLRQAEANRAEDREWARRHLLGERVLQRAASVQRNLLGYLERLRLPVRSCGLEVERLQRAACAALFLNAARRLPCGAYGLCRPVDAAGAPHVRFRLHPGSVLASVQTSAPADFVVFVEALCSGADASLAQNTRVRPEWLPELAPHYFERVPAGRADRDPPP